MIFISYEDFKNLVVSFPFSSLYYYYVVRFGIYKVVDKCDNIKLHYGQT